MRPFRNPTIFVSATSRGLRSLRISTAERLRRLGCAVVVQEEFASDYRKIKDMIRDQLAPCDAVVLLIGPAFGFEPTDWPVGVPKCSYTQLEYELAIEMRKPVYRFLASAKYPLEYYDPEPGDYQRRQCEYVARLKAQDHVWYEFDSPDQLHALLEKTRFHPVVKPNLPFGSMGRLFKGREKELTRVRSSLLIRPAHATAVTSRQTVHGLGGVGKTRFVIEYAHRYASEYSAVLYASADSPSSLNANLARLSKVLGLPEEEEQEQAKRVEAVERWLLGHAGWLLLLDNADTPEAQSAVRSVFAKLTTGHVLVTSRLTDWGPGVDTVELDTLPLAASTEFLLDRTARRPEAPTEPARQLRESDLQDAAELAAYLGGLALALEQAGAYICANRTTFLEYLGLLNRVEFDVLKWCDAESMRYPKSVALTWQASVEQLYSDGRTLLNLLCWLAPDPIPVALIRTGPSGPSNQPLVHREKALKELSDYSLCKWSADGSTVSVHRLVQDVTRLQMPEGLQRESLEWSLRFVNDYVPDADDARQWSEYFHPIRPHALTVVERSAGFEHPDPATNLLSKFGDYLSRNGELDLSEILLRKALGITDILCGPRSARMGRDANNLAITLMQQNRLEEAEQLLETARSILENESSADPIELASCLGNLAMVLFHTNRFSNAEKLIERVFALEKIKPGGNPARLFPSLINYAGLLLSTKRIRSAVEIYVAVLELIEKTVGSGHPLVATVLGNCATALQYMDRVKEAEQFFLRAIDIESRFYGERHPSMTKNLNNLAQLYQATNRLKDAEPLMREVLENITTTYGADHPRTAICFGNLGCLLSALNRIDEAESLLRQALVIGERVDGPDHIDTAGKLNNLANLLMDRGSLDEAEALLYRALAISKRVFGPRHPDLAIKLSNLGQVYQHANRLREAENVFSQALAIDEDAYGTHHTKVAKRLGLLAGVCLEMSRLDEAESLARRELTILMAYQVRNRQVHPSLANSLEFYDYVCREMGHSRQEIQASIEAIKEDALRIAR